MKGNRHRAHVLILTLSVLSRLALAEDDEAPPPPVEVVISVADQKLALVEDGGLVKKYPISTSKFGLGDGYNSYKTPLGLLRVCDKIGGELPLGSVIKHRNATGEILPANASGRDPIVTRILWLDGEEAQNRNAKARGIYIHGTVEESKLGEPVSYGCIRMRSKDVTEVFADVPVGTPVRIINDKLPHFRKPTPPKPEVLFADNNNNNKSTTVTRDTPHGTITVAINRPLFTSDTSDEKPEVKSDSKAESKTESKSEPLAKTIASKSAPEPPRMVLFGETPTTKESEAPKKLVAATKTSPAPLPAPATSAASAPLVQLSQPRGTPSPLRSRPEPVAEGPIIETVSRLSEPMHRAMQSSILLAGLPSKPKPPATQSSPPPAPPLTETPAAVPVVVKASTAVAAAKAAPAPTVEAPTSRANIALQTVGTDILFGMLYLARIELPPDLLTEHLLSARTVDEPRLAFRTTLPSVKHPSLP